MLLQLHCNSPLSAKFRLSLDVLHESPQRSPMLWGLMDWLALLVQSESHWFSEICSSLPYCWHVDPWGIFSTFSQKSRGRKTTHDMVFCQSTSCIHFLCVILMQREGSLSLICSSYTCSLFCTCVRVPQPHVAVLNWFPTQQLHWLILPN